ncbi:MAG: succinate dehydrogenase [Deltaproteobacteria bacterium]|nr:succinate dehydrogenase [Deltaproteobacteria bacterium]MBW1953007.1 succinate dehydrogenase [Deltaproteobacteria bacterium]MBW1985934.1 succinate dehydrogenase [Deltaproteobacteria bacterium]MBW2133694.1 succinate dehydrogenase [Deltaproteobacteria bacterium]
MLLQKTLTKSPRLEAWVELLELTSGLFLLLFLQFHIIAVSYIIFGPEAFDQKSAAMDAYYLSYIGIPLIIIAIIGHGIIALRKAPWRFQEMQIVWQHSRRLAHIDTWFWVVQIVTGMAILILATVHIVIGLKDWPIEAVRAAAHVQSPQFLVYLLLLVVAETHAMVGLYRIFVKWGWLPRRQVARYLIYIGIFFVTLGMVALLVFLFLVSAGGAQ